MAFHNVAPHALSPARMTSGPIANVGMEALGSNLETAELLQLHQPKAKPPSGGGSCRRLLRRRATLHSLRCRSLNQGYSCLFSVIGRRAPPSAKPTHRSSIRSTDCSEQLALIQSAPIKIASRIKLPFIAAAKQEKQRSRTEHRRQVAQKAATAAIMAAAADPQAATAPVKVTAEQLGLAPA
jgi:hypothetical protein